MKSTEEFSVFEKCKHIRKVLVNRAAEVINYTEHWSTEFSVKYLADIFENLDKGKTSSFRNLDFRALTKEEWIELGAMRYEDIILIPLYLVPYFNGELSVTCINGSVKKLSEVDTDARQGCIAYGVILD